MREPLEPNLGNLLGGLVTVIVIGLWLAAMVGVIWRALT